MMLVIHTDASHLSKLFAMSQAEGPHFLLENVQFFLNNGAVLNILTINKTVMSSAAKAELGALFLNANAAVTIRKTEEMECKQFPMSIQIDNFTPMESTKIKLSQR
ncbi:hypothetical protein ACHAW6_012516 [Cyclotella cf. meneghiniana]